MKQLFLALLCYALTTSLSAAFLSENDHYENLRNKNPTIVCKMTNHKDIHLDKTDKIRQAYGECYVAAPLIQLQRYLKNQKILSEEDQFDLKSAVRATNDGKSDVDGGDEQKIISQMLYDLKSLPLSNKKFDQVEWPKFHFWTYPNYQKKSSDVITFIKNKINSDILVGVSALGHTASISGYKEVTCQIGQVTKIFTYFNFVDSDFKWEENSWLGNSVLENSNTFYGIGDDKDHSDSLLSRLTNYYNYSEDEINLSLNSFIPALIKYKGIDFIIDEINKTLSSGLPRNYLVDNHLINGPDHTDVAFLIFESVIRLGSSNVDEYVKKWVSFLKEKNISIYNNSLRFDDVYTYVRSKKSEDIELFNDIISIGYVTGLRSLY